MPIDYAKMCATTLLLSGMFYVPLADAQSSEPQAVRGAVAAMPPVRVQAQVVAVNAGANSVTIKGPHGEVEEVAVGSAGGDVSGARVGGMLDSAYQRTLLLQLDKTRGSGIRERVDTSAAIPASGGRTAMVHRVDVIATVQKVDRKKRV